MLEYYAMYSSSLIVTMNRVESLFDGSSKMFVILMFLELHSSLLYDWIEDYFYQDMGTKWGYLSNIWNYLA